MHRSVMEGAGFSRSQQLSREPKVFMNVLIVKLGATGDVLRTTPLLRRLGGQIAWLTAAKNAVLLENLADNLRCFSWEERQLVPDIRYDLIINLEDTLDVGLYLKTLQTRQLFGAYVNSQNNLRYTNDSRRWFSGGCFAN